MRKFDKLRRDALDTCKWRGHSMRRVETSIEPGRILVTWECANPDCKCYAQVDTNPPPNGIDIGGSAVAVNCSNE